MLRSYDKYSFKYGGKNGTISLSLRPVHFIGGSKARGLRFAYEPFSNGAALRGLPRGPTSVTTTLHPFSATRCCCIRISRMHVTEGRRSITHGRIRSRGRRLRSTIPKSRSRMRCPCRSAIRWDVWRMRSARSSTLRIVRCTGRIMRGRPTRRTIRVSFPSAVR